MQLLRISASDGSAAQRLKLFEMTHIFFMIWRTNAFTSFFLFL